MTVNPFEQRPPATPSFGGPGAATPTIGQPVRTPSFEKYVATSQLNGRLLLIRPFWLGDLVNSKDPNKGPKPHVRCDVVFLTGDPIPGKSNQDTGQFTQFSSPLMPGELIPGMLFSSFRVVESLKSHVTARSWCVGTLQKVQGTSSMVWDLLPHTEEQAALAGRWFAENTAVWQARIG